MNETEYNKLYFSTRANNNYDGHANQPFGYWAQQDPHDLGVLIKVVSTIEPKKILEIGVNHGGCLVFWDHLAGPGGLTVGLDCGTTTHIFSMFNPDYCNYEPISELHTVPRDSHDDETLQIVKTLFDGSIDFLFIDGEHTYKGAKMDYEMYGPLVREGGIIGIDDLCYEEVNQFWQELEVPKEVTSENDTRIGIIRK
jgi:cephalosporin hydroxylase